MWQEEGDQDHDGDHNRIPNVLGIEHCVKVILELTGADEIMPGIDGKEATVEEQNVHGLYESANERVENAGKF